MRTKNRSAEVGRPMLDAIPTAPRVAYMMSRFPKLSETFVLYEILALEDVGVTVDVYPLLRHREQVVHSDSERLAGRAHYQPFISADIVLAQLRCVAGRPRAYFRTLLDVLRGTFKSRNFLMGAVGIFPKTVRFALDMERDGVQHVHAHFATHPALAAFIIHRLTGIPFSFTAHGSDLHVDRTMLGTKLEAAEFGVTICDFNRRMISEEVGPELAAKVEVVHCGVDTELLDADPHLRGSEDGGLRLACVASLERVKGHRHLLEALKLARDQGVDVTCELVGDGPLREEIRADIQRTGLESHVRMHGALARPAVLEVLLAVDAFALTSHPTRRGQREGVPVAIMEAMATRLPVISTRTGGIPELVTDQETGFLVEPGDVPGMADAIVRLASDRELRRLMGEAGRRRVIGEFDLRKNARQLASLFTNGHTGLAQPRVRPVLKVS